MKTPILILVLITLISCSNQEEINGYWSVQSDFYKAVYHINDFDNTKKAEIISYNDGTTKYNKHTKPNQYLFSNLKKRDKSYVDLVSGATKITSNTNQIKIIHPDTLEITTYLHNTPLTELWIKTTY